MTGQIITKRRVPHLGPARPSSPALADTIAADGTEVDVFNERGATILPERVTDRTAAGWRTR